MSQTTKVLKTTSGELALKLAVEVTKLRGGKQRPDLQLLDRVVVFLAEGQFEDEDGGT